MKDENKDNEHKDDMIFENIKYQFHCLRCGILISSPSRLELMTEMCFDCISNPH